MSALPKLGTKERKEIDRIVCKLGQWGFSYAFIANQLRLRCSYHIDYPYNQIGYILSQNGITVSAYRRGDTPAALARAESVLSRGI